MIDNFKEYTLPSIRDQQILAGGVGSGRGKSTEAQAVGRVAREASDAAAQIMSTAYGQGLDAGVRGIGLAPTIAQLGLQPGLIAQQVGDQRQTQEQALINATIGRYNQYQGQNGQLLDDYIRRIQGQAGSLGGTQSQTSPGGGSSPLLTAAGTGIAGAGALAAGYGSLAAVPGYGWAALAALAALSAFA